MLDVLKRAALNSKQLQFLPVSIGGRTKEHLKATFEDFFRNGQNLLLVDEKHMMALVLHAAGHAVNTAVSAAAL